MPLQGLEPVTHRLGLLLTNWAKEANKSCIGAWNFTVCEPAPVCVIKQIGQLCSNWAVSMWDITYMLLEKTFISPNNTQNSRSTLKCLSRTPHERFYDYMIPLFKNQGKIKNFEKDFHEFHEFINGFPYVELSLDIFHYLLVRK